MDYSSKALSHTTSLERKDPLKVRTELFFSFVCVKALVMALLGAVAQFGGISAL